MSTVIMALFEVVRTLSLAGDRLPEDRLAKVVDSMSEAYVREIIPDTNAPFLDSFALMKEALLAFPPTDEDEEIVRIAAYNLLIMEEKLDLDREGLRRLFLSEIERELGEDVANLVLMFERSIRASGSFW